MAENNQLSDETKNNSTDTSSTDASSAVIGNHENAIVPHKISNHDKLVQTMVMVDGEWINVNDTNDQANMKEDMHKVNKKVVEAQKGIVEAKNAADSAVKYADSAVSASKVNSDALVAQSSAVIEAKSAMDSATAEIQQLKANTASDVAQIRVDVAQVQNEVDTAKAANSASVDKLKSDIGLAQKDLDNVRDSLTKAQSAVEQNQKLINDSVAKINNDIAQNRQDIVTAQQANDDLAKQLDTYSKEAQEQGKTIKTIQDNQGGFSITIADVKGDVTKVSDTVDGLSAGLKDAQGNIDQIKQDAKGTLEQLSNAQGNITALQKDVSGIKLTIADHDKNIHTLQADSKILKDDMADAKGNISSLQKTSTSLVSEFRDHDGRLSKVEQTATEHTSELADTKGNLDKVTQKANTLQLLLSDAQKNIQNIQLDAKGLHDTLTGQSNQLASLNVTLNNLDSKYSGITGDLQSKQTALSTEQQQTKDMLLRKADKSEVDNVKGTVNQVSAEQKTMADQINQKVSSTEYQTLKDKVNGMKIGGRNLLHGTSDKWIKFTNSGWGCFTTAKFSEVSTSEYHTGDTFTYSATICNNGKHDVALQLRPLDSNKKPLSYYKSASAKPGQQNMRVSCTASVDANTYYMGVWVYFPNNDGSNDIVLVKEEQLEEGNVRTPWTPNPDDTIASIQKNTTAIDQTNKQISLKADQTEVDKIKNTASQNSSRLNVMANEISSKVTSTDVNNIVNSKGYATTSTVQSLVDQKAGTLNESITNLEGKFNSSSSINLAEKTNQGTTNWMCDSGTGATNLTEVNINGVRGVRFNNTRKTTSWWVAKYVLNLDCFEPNQDYIISFDVRTSSDISTQGAMLNIARGDSSHAYLTGINFNTNFKANQLTHISRVGHSYSSLDKSGETFYLNSLGLGQCDWVDIVNLKIARGTIDKGYSPAPSDNATVTQLQSVTASIDGLQSAVTNYQKDASSKYTQLSDLMQSKVNKGDLESVRTQLASSINERIQKGNLITQFNLEAGRALIQSNKIYFDADSFVMSPNSKAFIPSAYITNINADKITTGTLDAAKFNVKNFSADNITGGTLNGVVVKTGANDRYFQTSKDNIYWVRKGSMSLVGNDTYLNSANGLNIADEKNIQLTTWGGATVNKDGSITNLSGNSGHPKIVIDDEGKYNPDDIYGSAFGGGPGDSEIAQWVGNKEYTVLTRNQGFTVHLNDGNNKSTFAIQKDNKVGFYVGGGDDGNEIRIAGLGPIKLQGRYIDDGFNDGLTHTLGNLQVDNLHVRKWLGVDQSKNAIVKTSQGPVTINAYETAEYYFGDIGEGQTSTDGIAYIGIEKLFNETVNTTIPYHVFITAYGPGNIWVDQREHNRFIVKSDQPNLKFSWEIKAKRKGYEQTRLQNIDDKLNHMAATS